MNFTKLSPNQLTIIGFFLGAISSILFFKCNSSYKYLILGAIFYEISYIFDCIDGRVARIKHLETGIGRLLDSSLDQLRTFLILIGLTLGRYHTTGDYRIFLLGLTYAFLYPNFWLIQWRIESINNEYYNKISFFTFKETGVALNDLFTNPNDQNKSFLIRYKFPIIWKLKEYLKEKHINILSGFETADTITFFIFPILNKVELGFVLGCLTLAFHILLRFFYYTFIVWRKVKKL